MLFEETRLPHFHLTLLRFGSLIRYILHKGKNCEGLSLNCDDIQTLFDLNDPNEDLTMNFVIRKALKIVAKIEEVCDAESFAEFFIMNSIQK